MIIYTNNGKKPQKFSVLYDQRKKTADFFHSIITIEKNAKNYNKDKKQPQKT